MQKAQELLDVVTSLPKARLSGHWHPFSAERAHFNLNSSVSMLDLVSLIAFLARSVSSHQLFCDRL